MAVGVSVNICKSDVVGKIYTPGHGGKARGGRQRRERGFFYPSGKLQYKFADGQLLIAVMPNMMPLLHTGLPFKLLAVGNRCCRPEVVVQNTEGENDDRRILS